MIQDCLSGRHDFDALCHRVSRRGLQEISLRTGNDGRPQERLVVMSRKKEHPDVWMCAPNCLAQIDATRAPYLDLQHDDIGSVLILAFVTASLLSRVPFTPGGLGFVEAGLTGTLTLAGLSPGDAVLATLAYRLVSYWLPIPVGALAYVVHSRFLRSRGVRTESLAEFGQHELESLAGGRPMIE